MAKEGKFYFCLLFPEGKHLTIVTELGGGWAVSTPIPSASESEELLYHNHSPGTSSWESDVNVGNIFKDLLVNMVSTSHPEDEDEEMIQSDIDP